MITSSSLIDNLQDIEADLCIIGSGAVGLSIISQFLDSKLKIIVLEAGVETINQENQKAYDCIVEGHRLRGLHEGRFRVFGGSTTQWGGQSLPFQAIDFEKRDWVNESGWDIQKSDLNPFYPIAESILQVEDLPAQIKISDKNLQFNDLKFHHSKISSKPNLRENYRQKLQESASITLIQDATVKEIILDENQKNVESVRFINLALKEFNVKAKQTILCAGTIENARILLYSNKQSKAGIGNEKDLVGRYFQDHPGCIAGRIENFNNDTFQKAFNYQLINKKRLMPRLLLKEEFQREHKTLNITSTIQFLTNQESSFENVKNIYRLVSRGVYNRNLWKAIWKATKQLPQILKPVYYYFFKSNIFTPAGIPTICTMMEQEPNPASRVKISNVEFDEYMLPKAIIDWKMTDSQAKTLGIYLEIMNKEFNQLGLGKIVFADWLKKNKADWSEHLDDVYHQIGTTRMNKNPEKGVVDVNCKVHGINNLYIAGCSVFPTGGSSNPTLTAMALAIRLANHLKNRFESN